MACLAEAQTDVQLETRTLLDIPGEIMTLVCSHLSNSTIKSLRLTCSSLAIKARLHLSRVFLSANPRNIEVFLAVASHDVYRRQVVEVVWDDTLLAPYGAVTDVDEIQLHLEPGSSVDGIQGDERWPSWFDIGCEQGLERAAELTNPSDEPLEHQAERALDILYEVAVVRGRWTEILSASCEYYRALLSQQQQVLDSRAHAHALDFGLRRFPALRKMTITPAAHGRLFKPLYETPMIRSFPRDFVYPIPPGWLTSKTDWDAEHGGGQGFEIIMHALAQNRDSGRVDEIRIDSSQLATGLDARLFHQPCQAYTDFKTVLARPTLRLLHLDLRVDGEADHGWMAYRSGLLGAALAGGRGLEHVSLGTSSTTEVVGESARNDAKNHLLLPGIFPSSGLARLKHFGLFRAYVLEHDLLDFLQALPQSLESVELSQLEFLDGCYRSFLPKMRDTIGWADRCPRPVVTVALPLKLTSGRSIYIDGEVNEFLYNGGKNPFNSFLPTVPHGVGVQRDGLDPTYAEPY